MHVKDSLLSHFKKLGTLPFGVTTQCFSPPAFAALQRDYPCDELIYSLDRNFQRIGLQENCRYQIPVSELFSGLALSQSWANFVDSLTPTRFRNDCASFFETTMTSYYGKHFHRFFSAADIGYRGRDDTPLLFDFQIGINSPTSIQSIVRGVHLDNPLEIVALLLYFPEKNYDDAGLKLHGRLGPVEKYGKFEFAGNFETIGRVPYHQNHGAVFLNTIESFHSVESRMPCNLSRKLLNVIIELNPKFYKPLFTVNEAIAGVKEKKYGFGTLLKRIFRDQK